MVDIDGVAVRSVAMVGNVMLEESLAGVQEKGGGRIGGEWRISN